MYRSGSTFLQFSGSAYFWHPYSRIAVTASIKLTGTRSGLGFPPSNFASLGTYVLVPEVLNFICEHKDGEGEICIVDAINKLPKLRHVELTGKRFDLGNPLGFAQATTYATMKANPEFKDWLKDLIKE